MNYQHPERLRRLADDYVLGTMPPRSRRRLERLAADAAARTGWWHSLAF